MARLIGVAFCLVLPSLVATAGTEGWGDDASALLQLDTAMASIQTDSMTKSVEALRSLLAAAQNAVREHSSSLADSTEFYTSTVQPRMEEAGNFIVDKLATLDAMNKSTAAAPCPGCWTGVAIDILTLVYEAGVSSGFTSMGDRCTPVVLVVWWLTGLLTMTMDQKLTIPDAMDMLVQQFTSVGYGSSSQDSVGLKIFHGIHGIVSQMGVNRATIELFDSALGKFENIIASKFKTKPSIKTASVSLLIITAVSTFLFGLDLGVGKFNNIQWLDGFYQALITMTTIGYGDKSPTTQWGKALTPLTIPMITQAFSRWNDAAGTEAAEKDAKVAKGTSLEDMEICSCMGKNFCR